MLGCDCKLYVSIEKGFVAQRFHNYMILKVLLFSDPKLYLFKSDAYIFMQQSHREVKIGNQFNFLNLFIFI